MPDPVRLDPIVRSTYQREIIFYRELSRIVGVRTPVMYHGDVYEDSAVILMEDLSPAVPGDSEIGCSIEDATVAVRALASLHARWWQDPKIERLGWLWGANRNSDHIQLARPIDKGWSMAPREFREALPSEVKDLCSEELWAARLFQRLDDLPCTLTHPDFRLDNLLFDRSTKPTQVTIIDWGRVTFAPPAQALAYLLARESGLDADDIKTCLDLYQNELFRLGVADYKPEQALIDFRLGVLQVLAVSLWQFQSGSNLEMNDRILAMRRQGWERANRVLIDFDCVSAISE